MNHINFFFLTKLCQGAWISFLVFRCDDPTYKTNSCLFYFVRGLGYLSLSLGVTTLHITPVMLPCMEKMLLQWWWFTPIAWHAHNCEGTSLHKILNISCQNPVVGTSTDHLQQYDIIHYNRKFFEHRDSIDWLDLGGVMTPPYYPNPCVCKCVCLFVCLCVYQVVCLLFLCCHFECFCISNLFHVKMTKRDYFPFCRWASLQLEFNDILSSSSW